MKVYVVCQEWQNDVEFENDFELFETKEKAKDYFAKELEQLKKDYDIDRRKEFDDYVENEETAYYYNYSSGYKFDIWIEEREVL